MKINNQEINIDDLISSRYMHKEIKKGIFLSEYQIEVLERYHKKYQNVLLLSSNPHNLNQ